MNTAALVKTAPGAEPLDETVLPRARRRARRALPETSKAVVAARVAVKPDAAEAELGATVPPRKVISAEEPALGDILLYLLLAALVFAAWKISHMGLFKPTDDTTYWIGVVGGSMMLALFVYPLRKYVGFMRGLGKVKGWFWFHLVMGIGGPWLILVHSGFETRSLNAGVALYSMGVVVVSGVIGRFIYVRIHRGLHGERTSLHSLRERAGLVETTARSRLHFSPQVEKRLLAFEHNELRSNPTWATHLRQVTLLPIEQWITYVRCVIELQRPLRKLAAKYSWSPADLRRRSRRARRLVDQYLNAVVRVAQYAAYERLFALWHLAHLPFIYLLVISAIVHVVAVHAY